MYDFTLQYLVSGKYHEIGKGVIRKRAQQYRVKDGQLQCMGIDYTFVRYATFPMG